MHTVFVAAMNLKNCFGRIIYKAKNTIKNKTWVDFVCVDLQERTGRSPEEIKLKHQIDRGINECKELHNKLEESYEKQKKKKKLKEDELESRHKLMELLKQDIEYTEFEFKPQQQQPSKGFQLAKQARERRRKQREKGTAVDKSEEAQPLSAAQQQFIQESLERDKIMDEKLDQIKLGVRQLGEIAEDINQVLFSFFSIFL